MRRLTYVHNGQSIATPLAGTPVSIGRGEDATLRLPCKVASRLHAQVFLRDSQWMLEDLGSQNGTVLNGRKISGATVLKPGDAIRVGSIELVFEEEAPQPLFKPDEEKLARLLYKPESGKAQEALVTQRITIGRAKDNVLDIEHKVVSSHHCEVEPVKGRFILRDLDSSNGTYIGDKRITEHVLNNGDVILLGKVVKVYFINPLATPSEPPAQLLPPAPAPISARRPVTSAATAPPVAARGASPVNVLVGLLIAAALAAAGYFVPQLARPAATSNNTAPVPPAPPPTDPALSFEGDIGETGNPAGWVAITTAPPDTTLEIAADGELPGDGTRSLRLARGGNMSGPVTFSLERLNATPPTGGSWRVSLMLRGEDVSGVCVSVGINTDDGFCAAAVGAVQKLSGKEWTVLKAAGLLLASLDPAEEPRLCLRISGTFRRLWLDRLTIETSGTPSLPVVAAGPWRLDFDGRRPGLARVMNGQGEVLRVTPRMVASGDQDLAESDGWSLGLADGKAVACMAALPVRGSAETVDIAGEARNNQYFADTGLGLRANMRRTVAGVSLALELSLPRRPGAALTVADRSGIPLKMNMKDFHGFPYATVSEITLLPDGPCILFPRGVVAWFETSSASRLNITVRASNPNMRSEVWFEIFPRSVATARLLARALLEGQEFEKLDYYSAALARYRYVAENAPEELSSHLAARVRIAAVLEIRNRWRTEVDSTFAAASADKSPPKLDAALLKARSFATGFSGDEDIKAVREIIVQLQRWRESAVPVRQPGELEIAVGVAHRYLGLAREQHQQGHVLFALMLLDNILRDYADTPSYKEALALHDEIMRPLNDAATRDVAIDRELKEIDTAFDRGNYDGALQRCRALFKRFPDTPRNRDIMLRLRKIEEKFKG